MKHRLLTAGSELDDIIRRCEVCTVSMVAEDGSPYAVIMNFGYHQGVLYMHSAAGGKKCELLKQRPEVFITMSTDHELRAQNKSIACSFSMKYRSAWMRAKVEFVSELEEKKLALNILMKQYADDDFQYSIPSLENVSVWKLNVSEMGGRVYGY